MVGLDKVKGTFFMVTPNVDLKIEGCAPTPIANPCFHKRASPSLLHRLSPPVHLGLVGVGLDSFLRHCFLEKLWWESIVLFLVVSLSLGTHRGSSLLTSDAECQPNSVQSMAKSDIVLVFFCANGDAAAR